MPDIAYPGWDDLSTIEQLAELRLESASELYEAFWEDPTTWGDCREHGRTMILAEGNCTHCGLPTHEARNLP